MKVPLSWLRDYVAIELPLPAFTHRLTMAGLEVESVETIGADWRDVAIARVVDLERHPRADNLHVATLDRGGAPITVVTAATNLHVGAIIPHVAVGGRLPAGEVGSRTFQGITSEGMVCSADELGIGLDRDGIYLMEDDAPVGQQLADYLNETVLDIYITANRPDCMSMVGIAREVHALTGVPYRVPRPEAPRGSVPASQLIGVRIEDAEGCPRFTATVVQDAAIGPSPRWLQRRLYFAGVRPISNVVDVTNYVMLELGQPLHAFDRRRLDGDVPTLVARRARPGERLTTLDGQDRALAPTTMVVADEARARSVAGIMGGADSEIEDSTRDVVLEGAAWDRASIRLTAGALSLPSEAARRFGRGVDPELTAPAVSRAAEMIRDLAGGTTADGLVDVYPGRAEPTVVRVRTEQIAVLLGAPITTAQVVDSLTDLEFTVASTNDGALDVTVPSHRRFDVSRRADLAEEVARVVGYDAIPTTLPAVSLPEPRPDGDGGFADDLQARRTLAAAGLQEVITYSLVEPGQAARLDASAEWPVTAPVAPPLTIANPMSVEQSVLRSTLLGGLLDTLRTNLRHHPRVALFELARTWQGTLDPQPDERRKVGIAMTGPRDLLHWTGQAAAFDFFDVKGVLDTLAAAFRVQLSYVPTQHPSLHPGRCAEVLLDSQSLGVVGQLHPAVAERFDLGGQDVLVAEVDFATLVAARQPLVKVATPSRFPTAERDIALVLDEAVAQASVEGAIREAAGTLLTQLRLFDVYRGEPIPTGHKSLAYSLTYQAPDRTLADDEVMAAHQRVEDTLQQQFGAEVRGR